MCAFLDEFVLQCLYGFSTGSSHSPKTSLNRDNEIVWGVGEKTFIQHYCNQMAYNKVHNSKPINHTRLIKELLFSYEVR